MSLAEPPVSDDASQEETMTEITSVTAFPGRSGPGRALDRRRADVVHRGEDLARRETLAGQEELTWLKVAPLADPDHGYPTPTDLQALHAAVTAVVHGDTVDGARVHHRLPLGLRLVPLAVTAIDVTVLFSFFSDLARVPLDQAFTGRTLRLTVASVGFAVLCTLVAYAVLSLTGRRLRSFRDALGDVEWRCTGAATRLMTALSVVVSLAVGSLMYVRVAQEAQQGELVGWAATTVAVVVAVIAVVGNLAVVAVHCFDGSDEAALLRSTGRRLYRWERRRHDAHVALIRHGGGDPGRVD